MATRRADQVGRRVAVPALVALGVLACTGVGLVLAPASRLGQAILLVHVATGVLGIPFLVAYVAQHLMRLWERDRGVSRAVAGVAAGVIVGALATGVLLVAAYWSSRFPGAGFVTAHGVLAAVLLVLLPVHVLTAARSSRAGAALETTRWRRLGGGVVGLGAVAVVAAFSLLAVPPAHVPVPDDYPRTGDGEIFGASFAATQDGGFVSERHLAGSSACSSCHAEIFEEWSESVHRFSGIDNPLVATATRPAEQNGGLPAARFCAACHEPVVLLSGALRESAFTARTVGGERGVSCLSCHGMARVPGDDGNGRMIFEPPPRLAFFDAEDAFRQGVHRLLVRAFDQAHRRAMRPPILATSHSCSSCHTVNAHEGLNGFGFLRLHNENDDWSISAFARGVGEEAEVVRCQDCHMGQVHDSRDPVAARTGGKHRSHRFLAANTFVAKHLGGEEQLRGTEAFLRGEAFPKELDRLLPEGPPVSLALELPEFVVPGEPLPVAVVLENRSVGHAFPAGPSEVHETWVELIVRTESGEVLFESGRLGADGARDPAAFALVGVPVDEDGNEIFVTGGLAAGFRQRRAILHGASDREDYEVAVPRDLRGQTVEVAARLRYRKADADFIRLMEGFTSEDVPVTDVVSGQRQIPVAWPDER
ncbi:MAG: multiheme c-type cytochrome [Myxococcota bacterium]